jgi:hypothetical protein
MSFYNNLKEESQRLGFAAVRWDGKEVTLFKGDETHQIDSFLPGTDEHKLAYYWEDYFYENVVGSMMIRFRP